MTQSLRACIDYNKVKSLKDVKFILAAMSIVYEQIPENMAHFLVIVPAEPEVAEAKEVVKIDFDKVKKLDDVKLILESLGLQFDAGRVPAYLKNLVVLVD